MPPLRLASAAALLAAGPLRQGVTHANIAGRCEGRAAASSYLWPDHGAGGCQMTLASAEVRVEVAGALAQVVANYTYTSEQVTAIEDAAVSLSPPAGAVLVGFAVRLAGGGAPLSGSVRPRGGPGGAPPASCPRSSLSWGGGHEVGGRSGDSLRIPVGQVSPGDTVAVEVEYVRELHAKLDSEADGALQLPLPLPAGARRAVAGRRAAGGPGGGGADGKVTIQVVVAAPLGAAEGAKAAPSEIRCPTTGVVVEPGRSPQGAVAAALRADALVDVVVEIAAARPAEEEPVCSASLPAAACGGEQEAPFAPEISVQRHPRSGLLTAAVALPIAGAGDGEGDCELVLVLDRSTSMHGLRLSRVRSAAQTFLRSVPAAVRVNLVGFPRPGAGAGGDGEAALFPAGSRRLDQEAFEAAIGHLQGGEGAGARPRPRRGGAEQPAGAMELLRAALVDMPRPKGAQLGVVVITDRHPLDTDDAVDFIGDSCQSDCRLSTIGVGWGASSPFVEGAARAGGGSASFIAERGGAVALERALVTHLVEALRPEVRDVEVDWAALAAAVGAAGCDAGSVDLLAPSGEPGDAVRAAFASQGGVCGLQAVPLEASDSAGSGRRLLAMAFLGAGAGSQDAAAATGPPLTVRATLGGRRVEARVQLAARAPPECGAAGALAAWHLARALERDDEGAGLPGAGSRAWQLRALGEAYSLATAETHWVVAGGPPAAAPAADAETAAGEPRPVQCPGRPPVDDLGAPTGQGAAGRGQEAFGGADVGASGPLTGLSVRQAPKPLGALSVLPGLRHSGAALSALDLGNLGASLSLRSLPSRQKTSRSGLGPFDSAYLGATLSLRNFRPLGGARSSVFDLHHLGSSLSLGSGPAQSGAHGALQKPWWQGDADWDLRHGDPLYGDPFAWGDGPDDEFARGGGEREYPLGRGLSTRDRSRLGQPVSATDAGRVRQLNARLSALDVASLGSGLSLRGLQSLGAGGRRGGAGDPGGFGEFGDYYGRMNSLSVLDYLFMGSSLSMGGLGGYGRGRGWGGFADGLDAYGLGGWGDEKMIGGGQGRGAASSGGSLSVRSLARVGSSLSAVDPGPAAKSAELSSRLSVLDFQQLGASLSLRSQAAWRASPGPFGGRRAWPRQRGAAAAEDDLDYYGADLELPSMASALSVRSLWGEPVAEPAAADGAGAKTAWIGVQVAGGLLAPLLQVVRGGSGRCVPRDAAARLSWATAGSGGARPAELWLAAGPLPASRSGSAPLARLDPPSAKKRKKRRKAGKAKVELPVSLQLSLWCELTVYSDDPKAGLGPPLVATEPLPEPADEDAASPAGGPAALRAGLSAWLAALGEAEEAVSSGPAAPAAEEAAGTQSAGAEPLDATLAPAAGGAFRAHDEDPDPAQYYELLRAQRFDGSFDFGERPSAEASGSQASDPAATADAAAPAAAAAGLSAERLKSLAEAWGSRPVAHTAAALAALASRYGGLRKGWVLLAAKARAWLAAQGADAGAGCGAAAACVAAADLAVARWSPAPPPLRGALR